MRKQFRVLFYKGAYYPQLRCFWQWKYFTAFVYDGHERISYPTLDDAKEHIHRYLDQVPPATSKPAPPKEVWSM